MTNEGSPPHTLDASAQASAALSLFHSGNYREAKAVLTELLDAGIEGAGLHYLSSVCSINLGDFVAGVDQLVKECSLPEPFPEAVQLYTEVFNQTRNNTCLNRELEPGSYLVSGIAPGDSGTGRFLSALLPTATESGFHPIYPTLGDRFSLQEQIRISLIHDSDVLLMHPQTLGLPVFKALVENNKTVRMYVLDNSFFCIKSLNYRAGNRGECLDCIGNVRNCHATCSPFPAGAERGENIDFLEWLNTVAGRIQFYCQSERQAKLLRTHFGEHVIVSVIGMLTPEYLSTRVDVVFHGEALAAKGLCYFAEIAKRLPEYSFLAPAPRDHVDRVLASESLTVPPNMLCHDIRWSSGLDQLVMGCRLVMCPSLWSAPVEGALMKSLYYNGNVAVVSGNYSFEGELPSEIVLRLNHDLDHSAQEVRSFLEGRTCNREKARMWVERYNAGVSLKNIFS